MNAVFFYLVNEFFGPSGVFKNNEKSNINAVEYIIIWLSHMLNLKDSTGNILTNFYKIYIKNQEKYKNTINGVEGCNNYDDLIYKKNELMNITNEKLSKFYAPFKSLCNMYNEFNENKKDCTNCLNDAKEFVENFNELNKDYNNGKDSPYNQLLSTLSTDYDNLKNKCNGNSSFPTIDKPNITPKCPEQTSEQNSEQIHVNISTKNSEQTHVNISIIWLSHMLNLKDSTGNILTNFYKIYIKNQEKYKNTINGVEGCNNYDDLIYKKNELMNITNEKLSKFYAPFKSLCNMYNEFNENKKDCTNCLNDAKEFVENFNELNKDYNNGKDSPYNQLLSTLSTDYDNLKNKCN
ncbi:Plasmodium variant antigen protein Cir/Yir/Bir, putative, partial [Plasmodium berghei]